MPLLAYGVSFRTAAIDIRERLAFPPEELGDALARLRQDLDCVSEAAILSTCNRTEIYCALESRDEAPVADWVAGHRAIGKRDLEDTAYVLWDGDAARHLMRVASGLDSQVLGEPQIMGQVKAAYEIARGTGTLGPELNLLSQGALYAAKRVRTDTAIGQNPVSVAYVAVTMAQQVIDLGAAKALLIGAGETIELVARHLKSAGVGEIGIANRTLARAREVAQKIGAHAMGLGELPRRLGDYDLAISSTDAAGHIVSASMVERAMLGRKREPSAGERAGVA
ncbi:MAG: glutamyl-tRNA reductase, partial [Gammaproteobacteria bacterium]|nr:glutamyl-tRNA reductase [Gammaproteobacteria bacterium]